MFSPDFTDILIRSLYDAILTQANAKRKKILSVGLCDCKLRIIDIYFKNIIGLLIELNSIIYEISVGIDEKLILEKFKYIKSLFEFMYKSLYAEYCLSSKIILFFQRLQTPVDEQIFLEIEKFLFFLNNAGNDEQRIDAYREIHENILNWAEIAILSLSGLLFKCSNISEEIFKDTSISNPGYCCIENPCKRRYYDCKNCELHKKIDQNGEILKLYIVDELSLIPEWYSLYFDLFKKYHKELNKVTLILDYQLCSNAECSKTLCPEYLKDLGKDFNKVEIINYQFIDNYEPNFPKNNPIRNKNEKK